MPVLPKTYMARTETVRPEWLIVDVDNMVVGRIATQIATVLMGKHKATYTPHVDCGDYVIVQNVERLRFSGNGVAHPDHPYLTTKMMKKEYDRYTGWPGGRKILSGLQVWERSPDRILSEAVRRMLPKNKLGRQMLSKLKCYVGSNHPHQAQQPKPFPEHLLPSK